MKTVWNIFRDYINAKTIGTEITRKELLKEIEKSYLNRKIREYDLFEVLRFSSVTVDCYRNMSEKNGYLSKTDKLGVYKVEKHFDDNLTSSGLRREYEEHK